MKGGVIQKKRVGEGGDRKLSPTCCAQLEVLAGSRRCRTLRVGFDRRVMPLWHDRCFHRWRLFRGCPRHPSSTLLSAMWLLALPVAADVSDGFARRRLSGAALWKLSQLCAWFVPPAQGHLSRSSTMAL